MSNNIILIFITDITDIFFNIISLYFNCNHSDVIVLLKPNFFELIVFASFLRGKASSTYDFSKVYKFFNIN